MQEKESQRLHREANQEENDSKFLGLKKKAIRQERLERFEEHRNQFEQQGFIVMDFDGSKHTIDTQTDTYGVIDYFPKANKLLIRKQNKWVNQGLRFLISNFLPK